MPDNLSVTTNDGATQVAADEISGIKHQRVKVQYGADGSATDVSSDSPLPVQNAFLELTGLASLNNTDLVTSTDVRAYRAFSLQLTGTFVATVNVQGSNDGTTWVNLMGNLINSATPNATTNFSSSAVWVGGIHTRYVRIRTSAYTSGTVNAILILSSETPVQPTLATTVNSATGTTGTGVAAAGVLGFDGTNYQRITSSVRGSSGEKNALDVAQASALSFITVTAGTGTRTFGPVDTLGYAWWTAAFTALGSAAGSMALQGSHDNVNWFSVPLEYATNGGVPTVSTGTILHIITGATPGQYTFSGSLKFRYMRIQTTGTVTGTYTLQVALTATALTKDVINVQGGQNSGDGWSNPSNLIQVQTATMGYVGGALIGWDRVRVPNIVKTAIATASGSTALWTPTATRKFRIMRYTIDIPNSTIASSAGDLAISFVDAASTTILTETISIPSTATGGIGAWTKSFDLGNGYLSTTANNVLNINLSFALTAGGVRVTCVGTEE